MSGIAIGVRVRVSGSGKRPELNGLEGLVVSDKGGGQWGIELPNKAAGAGALQRVSLKDKFLARVEGPVAKNSSHAAAAGLEGEAPSNYTPAFWEARYASCKEQEWVLGWEDIEAELRKRLNAHDRILVVGCGNSPFSKCLHDAGYTNVVNSDLSPTLIAKMSERHPEMQWVVDDCTSMSFDDECFDAVIEKSLVDNLYQNGSEPAAADQAIGSYWLEAWRVLRPGGLLFAFNFTPRSLLVDKWMANWMQQVGEALGSSPWTIDELASVSPSHVPNSDIEKGVRHSLFVATKCGEAVCAVLNDREAKAKSQDSR
eukprot:TRINITY_DN67436_c0_g1_i1.p1 TRINITY_DN67436_c0_g1~~TRINITY_DN67436_c0_g1_i1.p1  ORF type:complete len:314 (+),score=63.16 TRINITY_DN67436_c0_g1_i1:246-1187(+)